MRQLTIALLGTSLLSMATPAIAGWSVKDLTPDGVYGVPTCSGVYIILRNGNPYYVGRSRVNIYRRLKAHAGGYGSKKVAELLGKSDKLTVEYECLTSVEQMESQLINELGTDKLGNMRRETDPADWDE